ncbi:SPOC domain-containing protein 1 isoform X2 [Ornithorhynchus anatinus]|uniref:SPOC domain-containing protein 1 isoform X2 n=1 Tax=Ornithorhynchus anatinus TaxID=9258 RepID=UPI0019D469F6|nr:SPOC domain-containing protein 1 isoform X2 [Ornithorhynchus anatinus]
MSSGQAGAPKKGRGPSADPGREEGPTGRPSASDGAVGAKGRAASGRSRGREGGRESLGERAAEAGKSSLPGTAFPGELSAAGRMAEDLRGASDGKRTETIEMETCLTVVRPQDKRKGQNAEPAAVGTEKKTEFLEKLHFVLHDALFETCSKKLKAKSEKDSSETVEESSQTEGPPAVEGSQNEEISRGPSQTDAAQGDPPANMRGFEDRMDFPDSLSDLCEQGVFSRFAIVEDEPLASASNLPEGRKETERPERQQLASIRAEDGEEKSGKALASMKTKASKKRSEERSKKEEEGSGTREETESANDLNQSFGDLDCDVDNLFSPGPFLDNYLFSEKDAEEERHQSISDADKVCTSFLNQDFCKSSLELEKSGVPQDPLKDHLWTPLKDLHYSSLQNLSPEAPKKILVRQLVYKDRKLSTVMSPGTNFEEYHGNSRSLLDIAGDLDYMESVEGADGLEASGSEGQERKEWSKGIKDLPKTGQSLGPPAPDLTAARPSAQTKTPMRGRAAGSSFPDPESNEPKPKLGKKQTKRACPPRRQVRERQANSWKENAKETPDAAGGTSSKGLVSGSVVRLLRAADRGWELHERQKLEKRKEQSDPGLSHPSQAAEEGRKKSRGRKDLAEDKKESEVTPSDPREKRKPSKPLKAPNPAKKPKSSVKPPTKPKKKNNSHPQKENSNPTTTSDHMGEKVRMTVQESLSRVLVKRKEEAPDLTMSEEAVADIATNIEVALFNLGHNTGNHYKNKYRSLFFNLNDKKNKDLFHQVIQGEITPEDLVRKSVTELASQELTEWRNQKMKHDLEIIEKEQREAPIRRITKITHKGEIEIQSDNDQDLTLEHLSEPVVYVDRKLRPQPVLQGDRTEQHEKHFLDPSCRICTGWQAPRGERGFNPPQMIPPSRPNTVNTSKSTITDQLAQVGPPDAEPTKTDQGQRTEPPDSLEPSAAPGNEPGGLKPKLPQWTTLWEGAFKMFCIEQFGAKIYLVSGSGSQLIQKLPAVVRSSGFILPKVAWENLDRIWPTEAQNICLVRIAPQGSHSFKYGRLLYSFLSEKQCFGVVDSEELDMYIMPLPASQQVPFKLYPLRGPVLEAMNYSLLLGLILPKSPLNEPGTTSPPADTPEMTPDMVTVEEQTEMKCYSPPRKRLKSPVAGKTSEPLPPEAPGTGQPAPSEESGPRDPQASALEEQLRNDVREGGDSDLGPPSHGVSSHQGASANPSLPSSPESTDAGLGGKPGLPGLSFYPRSQSSHWPVGPLGGPAPKEDPGGHLGAGCEERVRLSGERGASGLNPPGLQSLHPRPLELSSFYCVNHGAAQPSPHASLAAPQHPTPPSFQSHLPLGSMSCHQSAFNLVCHLENLVKMSNQIKASLQPVQASLQPDQASLQPDVASLQSEVASLQRVALRLASVNRAAPDPASLKQVVLDLASLDGAVPDPASLQLDAASLQWVALDPASLRRLALDPSSLQRMALDRASLKQAVLDPASLQRMPPNQVSLQRMTLDQSSLQQAVPDSAWMVPNPISLQPKAPDPVSVQQVVPDKASLRRAVPNPTRMVPNPVLPRMAPDPISPQ